ncbi:hypothetical protein CY35_17G005000 [Sphagnum magellanicum]|nr:hypothetical protein CY35_17G005000 [Sphagnum magellanicum]
MVVMKPLMSNPPLMRRFLHVGKATRRRRYIKKCRQWQTMQTMANHKSALYAQKCSAKFSSSVQIKNADNGRQWQMKKATLYGECFNPCNSFLLLCNSY